MHGPFGAKLFVEEPTTIKKEIIMKKYQLKNINCASCATKIENGLSKMPEVKFVNVNFANLSLTIDTDNFESVKKKIKELELEVEIFEPDNSQSFVSKNELAENKWTILKALSAIILLVVGLLFRGDLNNSQYWLLEYVIFVSAYLISGWSVLSSAVRNILKGRVFDEQFLMTIATLGAFAIHEMPEGVAVMLFYVVGELFQDIAVNRSRKSIKSLLEIKPDFANVVINNGISRTEIKKVSPEDVKIGDTIIVKAGERIPLDGKIIEGTSFVDTSALTGESVPRKIKETDQALAGMINQSGLLKIKVDKPFDESSISKILELVENATSKKAETEKFITTFARYYTPFVVFGALLIALMPPLLFPGELFYDWIYRALVVLVISCPCALVISIPLGYFGGVGGASRRGILVKGSNYLDALTKVKTVVFDKTGTLTKGEFKVSDIKTVNGYSEDQLMDYASHAEANSNHPVAKSILEAYGIQVDNSRIGEVKEISGYGITAIVDGKEVLAGNDKFLHKENIEHPICDVEGTVVHIVIDRTYSGYIIISDSLKSDSAEAISSLHAKGIETVMLTGDNKAAASLYAEKLKINKFYYELLPEDKVAEIEKLLIEKDGKVAFVGDGINDAPVIARADIGIAMGAFGSDAAVETADVVLMTDSPLKVSMAIDIASKTRKIVWQNIIFALGVKSVFIILGIFGIATMWEAVFGDMGVAIIAILNAMRVMK